MDDDRFANGEVPNAPPHDHAVHVYADDSAIGQELIRFVEDGLVLGESVVVVANDQNRESIAAWRSDHPSISHDEFLLVVDAAETLTTFMVAGIPDPALFDVTIGAIVDRAARGGRTVRVFGEMVALLWAHGNVTGALTLEALWNDLASNRRFFLLCAYPENLLGEAPLRAVNAMCERHSNLSLLGHRMQFAGVTTATSSQTQRLLIPIPTAVPAARQIAKQTLADWELSHLIQNCVIVTSEFAANAVLHAESSFRLMLSRDATFLRIAVEDAVRCVPTANSRSDPSNPSGLAKVQSIASDWGCDVTPAGKTVWAELSI
ncbi:MAG: MEDS domain-containing protein [Mycobacterium sp.]